jgi:hypothetical protein
MVTPEIISSPNLVSYEEMMGKLGAQVEETLVSPLALSDFKLGLRHGEKSTPVEEFKKEKLHEYRAWIPQVFAKVAQERQASPNLASTVVDLNELKAKKILAKAEMHYEIETHLVGPLISHFAHAIYDWQKEGKLKGLSVAMLRDFQPFYVALQELGANIEPWYLRRAMFSIDDELSPEDEAKIGAAHNGKLALWLEPLLTAEHLNLLDSGCWGTVVYDMAVVRSAINWLANSGEAQKLAALRSPLRIDSLHGALPKELVELLNAGLNSHEVSMRWGLMHTIVSDDQFLAKIKSLAGKTLGTTGLDHYSHAWADPRVANHQMIYSHIDVVAGSAMPDPAFGECINDTIEENGASKRVLGPTVLAVKNGQVSVVVEPNPSLEAEIIALAAGKGAQHATQIAQKRLELGMGPADPKETVAHMATLAAKRDKEDIFTGVLPHTPTWSQGPHFVANIWSKLAGNPYSTYEPFVAQEVSQAGRLKML